MAALIQSTAATVAVQIDSTIQCCQILYGFLCLAAVDADVTNQSDDDEAMLCDDEAVVDVEDEAGSCVNTADVTILVSQPSE